MEKIFSYTIGGILAIFFVLIPSLLFTKNDAIKIIKQDTGVELSSQDKFYHTYVETLGGDLDQEVEVGLDDDSLKKVVAQIETGAYFASQTTSTISCFFGVTSMCLDNMRDYALCSVSLTKKTEVDEISRLVVSKNTQGVWVKNGDTGYGFTSQSYYRPEGQTKGESLNYNGTNTCFTRAYLNLILKKFYYQYQCI
ncbi:MAG: hypothetical protein COU31_02290 [Candidatus Magasanikbacteria bacterium CG10_big_fil_rev_8_21_14_0_10_40_10]|uniref:Uncharacterized protein n=1 Tax=Candidatus Magasanikbacteria bacterium CG10_big_fil_rev_8_21_14_0_10_40_10 TaxID=1974648 RepID=A0A2M6W426_9BACT|nr:MAG: hypothetical protein COU31_02290 [Candidatus Magasanikbacteria bacterium CG10_big_fil_rev_8_21_14_0_10_40_10]